MFCSVTLKHLDEETYLAHTFMSQSAVEGSLGRNSIQQEPRAETEAGAMRKGCMLAQPLGFAHLPLLPPAQGWNYPQRVGAPFSN